jgi:xanthine dehydrogenase accessory factor
MKQWLETRQVLERLHAARRDSRRAALATVIRVRGSAYRHEGAKLLVTEDDVTGNVSGGCLEEDVREVARRVMRTGIAERRSWCGGSDEISAWDLGVGCEGEVEILIEPVIDDRADERAAMLAEKSFVVRTTLDGLAADAAAASAGAPRREVLTGTAAEHWSAGGESRIVSSSSGTWFVDVMLPPPRLLIVSGGDDARHLARLAAGVGFRVVVADRRPGLLSESRFPAPIRLVETDAARIGEKVVLDSTDFAVVMTHHFADDTAYARALLLSPVRYLGLLGPRARTERLLGVLRADATLPVDESRIFGPVGLDIGTDGAEQVALAVVAELLAIRSGRRPQSLRERNSPIHVDAGE